MRDKVRRSVEDLFLEAPHTKKCIELKEEMVSNLLEKYSDLVAIGKTEDEAYNITMSSIGNVDELIEGLKNSSPLSYARQCKERKKSAAIVSGAIGLYILGFISVIILVEVYRVDEAIVSSLFLGISGGATCLLVYYFMSRPKYQKEEDSIVEDFKEWKHNSNQQYQVYKSINSIIWLSSVVIFIWVSIKTMAWKYSWVIFIIGAIACQINKIYFELKDPK